MFPHTITIYHHFVENGVDNYQSTVLSGCYWYGKASIVGAGKGTENTGSCTVVVSPEQTAKFGETWEVRPGDRIVLGNDCLVGRCISGLATVGGKAIKSLKELPRDAMTVKAVDINICGSSVDNVTLTG